MCLSTVQHIGSVIGNEGRNATYLSCFRVSAAELCTSLMELARDRLVRSRVASGEAPRSWGVLAWSGLVSCGCGQTLWQRQLPQG